MLYRWDCETEDWQSISLEAGQPVRLGAALFVAQAKGRHCLLVADGGTVTVDGLPSLPLRVLADKDEVRVGHELCYFSAQSAAGVVPFTGESGDILCSRCKGKMSVGDLAVQCPRCGAWHHQTEALPCWTYDSRCSGCDQPTHGVSWQPEPLQRRSRKASE